MNLNNVGSHLDDVPKNETMYNSLVNLQNHFEQLNISFKQSSSQFNNSHIFNSFSQSSNHFEQVNISFKQSSSQLNNSHIFNSFRQSSY